MTSRLMFIKKVHMRPLPFFWSRQTIVRRRVFRGGFFFDEFLLSHHQWPQTSIFSPQLGLLQNGRGHRSSDWFVEKRMAENVVVFVDWSGQNCSSWLTFGGHKNISDGEQARGAIGLPDGKRVHAFLRAAKRSHFFHTCHLVDIYSRLRGTSHWRGNPGLSHKLVSGV